MDTHQIQDLLARHDRDEFAIAVGGDFLTLDGSTGRLIVELLRLANIGAAVELVRDSVSKHAPLTEVLHIASVTWPRNTP